MLILTSCSSDNNNQNEIDSLKNQINLLESDINELYNKINQLNRNYAIFDPSSKGYATINAETGSFVVTLDNLNKYANGYKATFKIGNPNLITYDQVKLHISWGEAYDGKKAYNEWLNALKSEDVVIDKSLLPGVWNKVTVVLSPATASETGAIFLSISTNSIYLANDNRKNTN